MWLDSPHPHLADSRPKPLLCDYAAFRRDFSLALLAVALDQLGHLLRFVTLRQSFLLEALVDQLVTAGLASLGRERLGQQGKDGADVGRVGGKADLCLEGVQLDSVLAV